MRLTPFQTLQGIFTLYLSLLILAMMAGLSYWAISTQSGLLERAIIREGKALVESLAISCTDTMLYEEVGLVEEGGLLDNYLSELVQRKDLDIFELIVDRRERCKQSASLCRRTVPPGYRQPGRAKT